MATRAVTQWKTRSRGFPLVMAAIAVIVGLVLTIAVALAFALNVGPTETPRIINPPVLGLEDDYGTRHRQAPAQLGPQDDYGTRHGR